VKRKCRNRSQRSILVHNEPVLRFTPYELRLTKVIKFIALNVRGTSVRGRFVNVNSNRYGRKLQRIPHHFESHLCEREHTQSCLISRYTLAIKLDIAAVILSGYFCSGGHGLQYCLCIAVLSFERTNIKRFARSHSARLSHLVKCAGIHRVGSTFCGALTAYVVEMLIPESSILKIKSFSYMNQ